MVLDFANKLFLLFSSIMLKTVCMVNNLFCNNLFVSKNPYVSEVGDSEGLLWSSVPIVGSVDLIGLFCSASMRGLEAYDFCVSIVLLSEFGVIESKWFARSFMSRRLLY